MKQIQSVFDSLERVIAKTVYNFIIPQLCNRTYLPRSMQAVTHKYPENLVRNLRNKEKIMRNKK